MKNRIQTILLILFSLCAYSMGKKPNVIMINVNDTNDFLGYMGSIYSDQAKTPNIDRLAAKSVAFLNAHCATPSCTPSRHALFYGKYPFNTGLYRYNFDVREIERILKDRIPGFIGMNMFFKENGYTTYGLGHNLGINPKLAAGNEWDHIGHAGDQRKISLDPKQSFVSSKNKKQSFGATQRGEEDFEGYRLASEAIEVLQQDHQTPFFLAVCIQGAHIPLKVPEKYFKAFDDLELRPFHENDLDDVAEVGRELVFNGKDYENLKKEGGWKIAMQSYLGILSFIDAQVGRVIEALESSEYADNTIVVLWSDHGNSYGRKLKLSKFHLWEPATRVPLIIGDTRYPEQSGVCRESTSLVDIYPTLVNLAGLQAPPHLDGVDLTPWMKDPQLERNQPVYTLMGRGNYAVRSRDWRYIRYYDGGEELYHNKVDQEELVNLIHDPSYADQVNHMREFLPDNEAPMLRLGLGKMVFHDADKAADEKAKKDPAGKQ